MVDFVVLFGYIKATEALVLRSPWNPLCDVVLARNVSLRVLIFRSRFNHEIVVGQVWRKTRTGRKKMSVKWLRKLDEEYPSLAETARRLNSEDGFVMMTKEGSNRHTSNTDRDSEGSEERSKRKKKHGKRKGGGSDGSGSSAGYEDGGGSGSGESSSKRGRKYGSDASRDGSLTPPTRNSGSMR